MGRLHVISHPLIEAKLTRMRDKNTSSQDFRLLLKEISLLMGYEITRDFETVQVEVETPICASQFPVLKQEFFTIVPILRAGLGMVDGLLELMPFSHVGHIGLVRDEETHVPTEYYYKMPEGFETSEVIVVESDACHGRQRGGCHQQPEEARLHQHPPGESGGCSRGHCCGAGGPPRCGHLRGRS